MYVDLLSDYKMNISPFLLVYINSGVVVLISDTMENAWNRWCDVVYATEDFFRRILLR